MPRDPLYPKRKPRSRNSQGKAQPSLESEGRHQNARALMVNHIAMLLFQKSKNDRKAWPEAMIIDFSRKLELMLYRSSPSLEFYSDTTTVVDRMKAILKKIVADKVVRTGEGNDDFEQPNRL
mmetsp:Transcript_15193/g.31054  ORF Transcript_15193/g.31054 Transcript_15193/m.31054 type:complete len:122 (-) Transcript_15193:199-564(-)